MAKWMSPLQCAPSIGRSAIPAAILSLNGAFGKCHDSNSANCTFGKRLHDQTFQASNNKGKAFPVNRVFYLWIEAFISMSHQNYAITYAEFFLVCQITCANWKQQKVTCWTISWTRYFLGNSNLARNASLWLAFRPGWPDFRLIQSQNGQI